MRKVRWNEPFDTSKSPVYGYIAEATEDQIIGHMKQAFPERNYTDENALRDFMVVHWAWFVDDEDAFFSQSSTR